MDKPTSEKDVIKSFPTNAGNPPTTNYVHVPYRVTCPHCLKTMMDTELRWDKSNALCALCGNVVVSCTLTTSSGTIIDTKEAKIKELEADLQKAHINNAYYIGKCGELEAENERLWERDVNTNVALIEALAKLDKVREYCEEHIIK